MRSPVFWWLKKSGPRVCRCVKSVLRSHISIRRALPLMNERQIDRVRKMPAAAATIQHSVRKTATRSITGSRIRSTASPNRRAGTTSSAALAIRKTSPGR